MIDFLFAWVDFHPSKHHIIFGADSQVSEHLEKLKAEYPFKYQWFTTWLGENWQKISQVPLRKACQCISE